MASNVPFEEAVAFVCKDEIKGKPPPFESGTDELGARPVGGGWSWIDVPSNCVGLAYRVSGGGMTVEALEIVSSLDMTPSVSSQYNTNVPIVHMSCSANGKLIAIATADGYLSCLDVTSSKNGIYPRWTLKNVHSYANASTAGVSTNRDHGAGAAGPIRALCFHDYWLLLVDTKQQKIQIYDAATQENPQDLVKGQLSHIRITSGAWCTDSGSFLVGDVDGSIHMLCFDPKTGSISTTRKIPFPGSSSEPAFACTHLQCINPGSSVAAGFCRVIPSDGEEDEDDEDDPADHEVVFFVGRMDASASTISDWADLGDVVAFFDVPKHGRHVFYTSFFKSSGLPVLLVGNNVASDIGVVVQENGEWKVVDLQEGNYATTPTNDDDEYTFPLGFAVVYVAKDKNTISPCFLLISTDGILSVFDVMHSAQDDFFDQPRPANSNRLSGLALLGSDKVPPTTHVYNLVPDDQEDEPSLTSEASGSEQGTLFKFGSTSNTFGPPSSSIFSPAKNTGTNNADSTPNVSGSVFGSGASFTFGSGQTAPTFGTSSGGFAALAKSKTASGFGTAPGIQNPFNAFAKPSKTPTFSAFPAASIKPLFGSKTDTKSDTGESPFVTKPTTNPKEPGPSKDFHKKPEAKKDDRPGAEQAAKVFDNLDTQKIGKLPASKFEDLLDELGEGFHGEQFDEQLALVDPQGTGKIEKSAFISWYVNLLAGDDKGDDDELDDEEKAEREEETNKAKSAFMALSKSGSGDDAVIPKGDFGKLLESMGTVYCEEEHRKTIRKLEDDKGMMSWKSFSVWYIDWLFGDEDDDEDDDEDEEDTNEEKDKEKEKPSKGKGEGWGDIFGTFDVFKDGWKCGECLVQNKKDATVCVACGAVRPGYEKKPEDSSSGATSSSSGGISSKGFSFGIPESGGSVGFGSGSKNAFGAPTSGKGSGFTFGGTTTTSSSSSSTKPTGFSFGTSTSSTPASSGFSFGSATATPFGGGSGGSNKSTGTKVESGSSSSSYPPMPSKAPTNPFGKPSSSTSEKPSSSSSYPPMSSKAPTNPFGKPVSEPASKSTASSGSSYPPMSSKAPTNPFGKPASKVVSKSTASSSSSYPPMSSKAPTNPFGKPVSEAASKSTASSGSSYPPMSSKAPTNPFGKSSSDVTSKEASSSSYPPMSSKAPVNPFGKSSSGAVESSSYPPMSSKAPKSPFGKLSSEAPSKSAAVSNYPPMSTKAPVNPFQKPSSDSVTKTSSVPGYPPMSSKAPPDPFGKSSDARKSTSRFEQPPVVPKAPAALFGKPSDSASKATSASLFAPGSAMSFSPFSMAPKPGDASLLGDVASNAPSSTSASFPDKRQEAKKRSPAEKTAASSSKLPQATFSTGSGAVAPSAPSESSKSRIELSYETQFLELVEEWKRSIERLSSSSLGKGAGEVDPEFQRDITQLVSVVQKLQALVGDAEAGLSHRNDRAVFLMSRMTDIDREAKEARRLVEMRVEQNASEEDIAQQPLDAESELIWQKIASKAILVPRLIDILRERVNVLDAATNGKTKQAAFMALKNASDLCEVADRGMLRAAERVSELDNLVPPARRDQGDRNEIPKSAERGNRRRKLKPLELSDAPSALALGKPPTDKKWENIEARMHDEQGKVRQRKTLTLRSSAPTSTLMGSERRRASWHKNKSGQSFLLSSQSYGDSAPSRPTVSINSDLFPADSSGLAPRRGWDDPYFRQDQQKVKAWNLKMPSQLSEVDSADAVRESLSRFGTTPEKVNTVIETKKRGEHRSGNRDVSFASSPPKTSAVAPTFGNPNKKSTPSTSSASSTGQPLEPVAASLYPPMSKLKPKPFFSGTEGKAPVSMSSLGAQGSKSGDGAGGLASLKGLGDSLATPKGDQKTKNTKIDIKIRTPVTAIPPATTTITTTQAEGPDYKAILTKFYEQHNPSRVGEVERTLQKYKGRETEMFNKLALKYKVPNPLESSKPQPPSTTPFKTSSMPNPFQSGGTTNTAPATPFGNSGQTPFGQSVSPFAPKSATPTGAPATSVFGQQKAPASQFPFGGPATQAPTPFGSAQNPQPVPSTSPFGASPPMGSSTPFGAPSGNQAPSLAGKTPREMLTAFYQKSNPSKLGEVDKVLLKYKGKEEQLFRNLAKKYNIDPGVFGLSSPTSGQFAPSTSGFGQPSPLGGGSVFGVSPAPAPTPFSGPGATGFGQTSMLGGNKPTTGFGPSSFGGGPGGSSSFGSLAQQHQGGFGSGGGFGSPFGGASTGSTGGFGMSQSPFGGPRR